MSTLALADQQSTILASLRRLKGRGTVGDVMADSGLGAENARAGLKALLETHHGHLAVADSGELVYEFDPKLIERGTEPVLSRISGSFIRAVHVAFKVWIVTMLVVYFVTFVVLIIVAASKRKGGGSNSRGSGGFGGGGRHRGGGGGHGMGLHSLYWIWGPRWRIDRPYYGRRWESTLDKEDRVPFYKKVFAFVFGPDRPTPTQQQLDRAKLRLIRARHGVLTTAELVEHTGSTFDEAESDLARMVGAYDGEPLASPNGEVVYVFPGIMASVDDRRPAREPNPAWLRLEHPQELTGNTATANAIVAGMNSFTLAAAASAPWFIFPRLGIGGPEAFVALVLVPVVYSFLFFAGPLMRMTGVVLENRRRRLRNVRRLLVGLIYGRALDGDKPVRESEVFSFLKSRLPLRSVSEAEATSVLRSITAEVDANVSTDDKGALQYTFGEIRAQFAASEALRSKLRLERKSIGDIVFSTADTAETEGQRDLALFDQALLEFDVSLDRDLPSLDRVSFEDDFSLVEFDEQLKNRDKTH